MESGCEGPTTGCRSSLDEPPSSHRQQHCTPPFLLRLQGLLTLFTESFASFDHSTCALSVPGLYASLRWIHIALQTAVPSHSTQGYGRPRPTAGCPARGPTTHGPYGTIALSRRSLPGIPLSGAWVHPGTAIHSRRPQHVLNFLESRSSAVHVGPAPNCPLVVLCFVGGRWGDGVSWGPRGSLAGPTRRPVHTTAHAPHRTVVRGCRRAIPSVGRARHEAGP